jgi:hypothetical protein
MLAPMSVMMSPGLRKFSPKDSRKQYEQSAWRWAPFEGLFPTPWGPRKEADTF